MPAPMLKKVASGGPPSSGGSGGGLGAAGRGGGGGLLGKPGMGACRAGPRKLQMPERSGWPSGALGAGASKMGFPAVSRGTPVVL